MDSVDRIHSDVQKCTIVKRCNLLKLLMNFVIVKTCNYANSLNKIMIDIYFKVCYNVITMNETKPERQGRTLQIQKERRCLKMKLCYQCFLKYYSEGLDASKLWDKLPCSTQLPETCDHCQLTGLYVRATPVVVPTT